MSNTKIPTKTSKFVPEDICDFINESQFLKNSPKPKKSQKRQKNDLKEDEDISKLIGLYQNNVRKRKTALGVETCKETRQKLMDIMNHQWETRKVNNEYLLKSLSEVLSEMEIDYNAMKDNERKLEHLTTSFMKCIQKMTLAHKEKFKILNDIHASFMKKCEEMDNDHKAESDKLADQLEYAMNKLQEKLISETKRSSWETLRQTIFNAMQNDL